MAVVVLYQHPYAHAAQLRLGCACLAGADGGEAGWRALINAGANDFGGISPVTKDYVNPEKPWPHLHSLAAATAAAGKALVPRCCFGPHKQASPSANFTLLDITSLAGEYIHRQVIYWGGSNLWQILCVSYITVTSRLACRLTVYPEVVRAADRWLDSSAGRSSPFAATLRQADGSGFARASPWCPGMAAPEGSSAASEDRSLAPEGSGMAPKGSGMASPKDGSAEASDSAKPPQERFDVGPSMSSEESSAVPEQHAHSSPPAPVTGVVYTNITTGLPNTCLVCGCACISGCQWRSTALSSRWVM